MTLFIAGVVALSSVFSTPDALSAEYTLMPSPQTVHIGHCIPTRKPVLTINSGNILMIERAISRPTGHEKAITEFIVAWFQANGLEAVR